MTEQVVPCLIPWPALAQERFAVRSHSFHALGREESFAIWNPTGKAQPEFAVLFLPDAAGLQGKRVWFLTGTRAFDRSMSETLDHWLRELGIPHEFHLVEGGHELRVVVENLAPLLRFLEKPEKSR